ncbi:MAG: rhodanese-like domain-containing protein [Oscillospiraceae bacterium]|nr:rhodanese-like domain-containing protein [Oscillospiraceae bacterium]
MKRIFLFVISCLLLCGCGAKESAAPSYRQISMEEAIKIMETEEGYILLDVRTEAEFAEAHIPGAICIPNESIGSETPGELPDKEQTILVYCRSGNRSKQASQKLANLGYSNILEFGGIIDWPGETVSGS